MVVEAHVASSAPGVAALAQADDSEGGSFWLVDGNENDPHADAACRAVTYFLSGVDLKSADIGQTISEVDTAVLPSAARAQGLAGLAVSLMIGRVSSRHVTIGHVGEVRAYLLAGDGRPKFVSREHNAYNLYPETVWKRDLGYSEQQAKATILGVVGGGTADVEVHVLPKASAGALIALSHLCHGYADTASHVGVAQRLVKSAQLPDVKPGNAIALLKW